MSEWVKPCGAYVRPRGGWPVRGGCQRPGIAEGGLCKEHAAGKKRSEAARAKADAKYEADRAEDKRRRENFDEFIAHLDHREFQTDALGTIYQDVRDYLRMQSTGGWTMSPLGREETK